MFFLSDEMPFSFDELLLFGAASGGKAIEDTATGNPLTFLTDLSKPLKSLLIPFTPVQEGSGDPSPSNVRNIVPWDGLTVWNGGKNLFNKDTAVTGVWWKGNVLTGGTYKNYKASDKIPVLPNVRYVLSRQSTQQGAVCYFDKNKQYVDQQTWDRYTPSRVIPDGVYYVSFSVESEYIDSAQFEVGQTATAYEPYKPITETDISFPSPVYGGILDMVSGVLMNGWNKKTVAEIRPEKKADHIFQCYFSDRKYGAGVFSIISDAYKTITSIASTGSTIESLYAQCGDGIYINSGSGTFYICDSNYTEVEAFQTARADVQIVYEVAEPQEIQLTPQQINALVGNNTIWSDANGEMTAVYFKKA